MILLYVPVVKGLNVKEHRVAVVLASLGALKHVRYQPSGYVGF